jgi:hypothetical protein
MNETYTRDQAMERLGIKSWNAFKHLAKKFPESFVLLKQGSSKFPRYDKDALDKLANKRESLKDQLH